MAKYRQLFTSFWKDAFITELTPEDKLFYIYLMSNAETTQCGIYPFIVKYAAIDTGYSNETIEKLSDWCMDMEDEAIIMAIEEAVKHNARSFVYIERNLNNCLSMGYTTADGVKSYQRDFQKGKSASVKETSVIPNAKAYKLFEGEDEQWVSAAAASSEIVVSRLKIFDKIFTLKGIKEECKRLKIQGGLDIVFIDYLQLINSEEKHENRTQDISKISRSLKLMAKELDVTVLALSQLSRAPETRADHRPLLSDLRESGAIEQDADIVMFLYRDEYYYSDTDKPNTIECILAKNRNGEVGTVRLKWKGQCQKVW